MKLLEPREGYDLYAPNYRKDHAHLDSFDWEPARQLLVEQLEKKITHSDALIKLVDIGCGDGRVLKRIIRLIEQKNWTPKVEVHGWDISEGMLKQARKALPSTVILERRDLLELPISSKKSLRFQLACSFFVLVHIPDPADFLAAADAFLEPGGILIFNNIPQRDALVLEAEGQKFRIEYHHHEHDTVREAISASNFDLIFESSTKWSNLFCISKSMTNN